MELIEILQGKRLHINRLANQSGANGEVMALANMQGWIKRPKGKELKVLLEALRANGCTIKGSSFDAIALQADEQVDFLDPQQVRAALAKMCFVEIKSCSQARVKPEFNGFFSR